MLIKFTPLYAINLSITSALLRIESTKEKVRHLFMTPSVLFSLRETARLYTTHYSTMIEGNRLEPNQIKQVLKAKEHFPGRMREENEVKGYYAALQQIEGWVAKKVIITEQIIQTIHALVMGGSKTNLKPTPYRDGKPHQRPANQDSSLHVSRS